MVLPKTPFKNVKKKKKWDAVAAELVQGGRAQGKKEEREKETAQKIF